jgi:hypothetical protein
MDDNQRNTPLSVGGWIGTLIVMAIPLVNIIMTFVWAFGKGNIGRKHYCIAVLILALISIAIGLVVTFAFGVNFAELGKLKELYQT